MFLDIALSPSSRRKCNTIRDLSNVETEVSFRDAEAKVYSQKGIIITIVNFSDYFV